MRQVDYGTVKTKFGWCSYLATDTNILFFVSFANESKQAAFKKSVDFASAHEWELGNDLGRDSTIAVQLRRFADGERETFDSVRVDTSHLSDFQGRVIHAVRKIGYGKTLSYGEIAAQAGSPRAARAVGTVMKNNRTPIVVPCHRVVASGGAIGGYSAADGVSMKRRLLELESSAVA